MGTISYQGPPLTQALNQSMPHQWARLAINILQGHNKQLSIPNQWA